jgi:predicted nucleic acid-binding protein
MDPSHSIVVTDTSLLINFLVIDRVSLLSGCGYQIYITDHVISEVTAHYPEQIARLKKALDANQLQQITITDQAEILLFQNLTKTRRLGVGECSAIAVAIQRGFALAIDDKRARKHATSLHKTIHVIGTQDFMVMIIRARLLDVPAADAIKHEWEKSHGFTLKIRTFADLL